jgi:hypothetical protein
MSYGSPNLFIFSRSPHFNCAACLLRHHEIRAVFGNHDIDTIYYGVLALLVLTIYVHPTCRLRKVYELNENRFYKTGHQAPSFPIPFPGRQNKRYYGVHVTGTALSEKEPFKNIFGVENFFFVFGRFTGYSARSNSWSRGFGRRLPIQSTLY